MRRLRLQFWLFLGLSVPLPTFPADSVSIRITSPAPASTISGAYTLTVDTRNAPTTAYVEYTLGSLRLGVANIPPFSCAWNTGYIADGLHSIQAVAHDVNGTVLSTDAVVTAIRNHGRYLVLTSPDLEHTLSGEVRLYIAATDTPGYYPARWNVFIDGRQQFIEWSDNAGDNHVTVSPTIDTSFVLNGKHELHVEVASGDEDLTVGGSWAEDPGQILARILDREEANAGSLDAEKRWSAK